jgi:uncharacterized damage-inducible protein DinB
MTYYGGKELADAFRTVRGNTVQIAEDIPENLYDFKPAPDVSSVRDTLKHIAVSTGFQSHIHGNKVTDMKTINFMEIRAKFAAEEAKLHSKAEIVAALKSNGDAFASYLETLPESVLAEQVTMPPGATPPTKSRFEMLLSAKEHEMHHRGQLMTMERMNGIVPHVTRIAQERMARMMAAAQTAKA